MKNYSSEIRPKILPTTSKYETPSNSKTISQNQNTMTISKLFLIGLLGFTAFYATNYGIDWKVNLVAQPQLDDHHYNNILNQEFSAHLQKRSKRHLELMEEPEKIHKLHESNVGMGFNMYF